MIDFLIKHFVKDWQDTKNAVVRQRYGRLGSLVGVAVNLLLFGGKFSVGTLMGSVAVTADGVNNLSDAGSSLVSLISFRLAGKPADREHPYGHARVEYLAAMFVAIIILLLGLELGQSSLGKVAAPAMVEHSPIMLAVLVLSILAKLWLWYFNRQLDRRIDSAVMRATAADSLSDVMSTGAVLLSTIISPIIGYPLDGWMGLVVSGFILFSGIGIIRDAMNKLLGDAPDAELVGAIEDFVLSHEGVLGVHDLMIHSYGPGRCFASMHAEVDAQVDIMKSHDLMDNIEREILQSEGVHLVLHLDPIVTGGETLDLRRRIERLVTEIDEQLSIHDFRAVLGETHNNLIFDMLVPIDLKLSNDSIKDRLNELLLRDMPNCYAVVTFDRAYTPSKK